VVVVVVVVVGAAAAVINKGVYLFLNTLMQFSGEPSITNAIAWGIPPEKTPYYIISSLILFSYSYSYLTNERNSLL